MEEIHMIKVRRNLFIICGAVSLFYYLVCLAYAGNNTNKTIAS